MPNWKTHMEIAKRVNKYFNYRDSAYDIFLFASILPDINNGFIVKDISKILDHKVTHFSLKIEPTYLKFKAKYQEKLRTNDPLYWGYLLHLYVDYNFNNDFYTKVKTTKYACLSPKEQRELKQNDFKAFNNKFMNNTISLKNIDELLKEISQIAEVEIIATDVTKVLDFINKQKPYPNTYKFYQEAELTKLMDKIIKDFEKEYHLRGK